MCVGCPAVKTCGEWLSVANILVMMILVANVTNVSPDITWISSETHSEVKMRTFCGLSGYKTLPNKFKSSPYSPSKSTKNKEVSLNFKFLRAYSTWYHDLFFMTKHKVFYAETFTFTFVCTTTGWSELKLKYVCLDLLL